MDPEDVRKAEETLIAARLITHHGVTTSDVALYAAESLVALGVHIENVRVEKVWPDVEHKIDLSITSAEAYVTEQAVLG